MSDKIPLTATVLFPCITNARYLLTLGNWEIIDHNPAIAILGTEFDPNDQNLEQHSLELVEDLENILLAFYICDFLPKKIHHFEFSGIGAGDISLRVSGIFGTGNILLKKSIEQMAIESFNRSTFFCPKEFDNINYAISNESLNSWHTFFKENQNIARGLKQVQESYGLLHALFSNAHIRYFDEYTLRSALLLLISGLEGLFTQNKYEGGITKKFSESGATYYQRFVPVEYFTKFPGLRKFSKGEIYQIFYKLYDVRSLIAHGSLGFINEKIHQILQIAHVASPEVGYIVLRQSLLLAVNLLQVHVLGIVIYAKGNLSMGTGNIHEMPNKN